MLDINDEDWKYQDFTSNTVAGNSLEIVSNEQDVIYEMQKLFCNKPFVRYHCQGFELYPLYNSYIKEEEQFLKIV